MTTRVLIALPVHNEARHVTPVLREVLGYGSEVLVVDDGSTDATAERLGEFPCLHRITHPVNRGYGAALASAFDYAVQGDYEVLVTMDCDGQHQPAQIPELVQVCVDWGVDVVSGSRYLRNFKGDTIPPPERRRINEILTAELNARLGLRLTDAFCGFKAYRVASLPRLEIMEPGYAMPLELWVQAAALRWTIIERPVRRIYLEETRSFGGSLDNASIRLAVYREVLDRSIARWLPSSSPAEAVLSGGERIL